jgi:hypothetical protein
MQHGLDVLTDMQHGHCMNTWHGHAARTNSVDVHVSISKRCGMDMQQGSKDFICSVKHAALTWASSKAMLWIHTYFC